MADLLAVVLDASTLGGGKAPVDPANLGSLERPGSQNHGIGSPARRSHTRGVWEGRAESERREIAAFSTTGLGVAGLHAAALDVVRRVVPYEQACWASVDPDTLVMTSVT